MPEEQKNGAMSLRPVRLKWSRIQRWLGLRLGGQAMKRRSYSDEPIIGVLKQRDAQNTSALVMLRP